MEPVKKPRKPGSGRPKKEIRLPELRKLCEIQCTDVEIGAFFGIDVATIERRRATSQEFRDAEQLGRARGRISLRRRQFQAAMKGNTTMLIWMGKQLLGQRDVTAIESVGVDGQTASIGLIGAKVVIEYQQNQHGIQNQAPDAPRGTSENIQ